MAKNALGHVRKNTPVPTKGETFGLWVLTGRAKKRSASPAWHFECLCECGTKRWVVKSRLVHGKSKSCGCLKKKNNQTPEEKAEKMKEWWGRIRKGTNLTNGEWWNRRQARDPVRKEQIRRWNRANQNTYTKRKNAILALPEHERTPEQKAVIDAYRKNSKKTNENAKERRAKRTDKERKADTVKNRTQRLKNKDVRERSEIFQARRLAKWRTMTPKEKKQQQARNNRKNKRRAKELNAILPTTDFEIIKSIYDTCKRISQITEIAHNVDHIIPLARGGAHHQENLQIITASENFRKSTSLDFHHQGVWADNDLARESRSQILKAKAQ